VKRLIHHVADLLGYRITRVTSVPVDFMPVERELFERVRPFTCTGPERVLALANAVRYLVANRIPGAMVECGVWRGGSMMAVAHTLNAAGDVSHDLYLFDTFTGMTEATELDVDARGVPAAEIQQRMRETSPGDGWCSSPLEEVRANLTSTGYPEEKIHFIQGKVEETLPAAAPSQPIALLRLDTDWYESTLHELIHLYPLLVPGGVLIVDDYGDWQGARKAVDEFIRSRGIMQMLHRIDATGRLLIKP
jgi:O-methyltransferase